LVAPKDIFGTIYGSLKFDEMQTALKEQQSKCGQIAERMSQDDDRYCFQIN